VEPSANTTGQRSQAMATGDRAIRAHRDRSIGASLSNSARLRARLR